MENTKYTRNKLDALMSLTSYSQDDILQLILFGITSRKEIFDKLGNRVVYESYCKLEGLVRDILNYNSIVDSVEPSQESNK